MDSENQQESIDMNDHPDPPLYLYQAREPMSLENALQSLDDGTIGLLYTPEDCQFTRVQSGLASDYRGQALDPATVFEARLFNADGELRWLRNPQGMGDGRTVLLRDQPWAAVNEHVNEHWTLERLAVIKRLDNAYLLWGQWQRDGIDGSAGPVHGWSSLAASRVGWLRVPQAGLRPGQRMRLTSIEYLGYAAGDGLSEDPGDANVAVIAERLTGLQAIGKASEHTGAGHD